jgi:thiamine kinase-like enzyme
LAKENSSLDLLTPVPQEQLLSWLGEFYGKKVRVAEREVLRHRDLSFVERLRISDSLPTSLIYKLVLPPWDVEQDLHERVLIPSISNSAQLYLSAHYKNITALFLEDLGSNSLLTAGSAELANRIGEDLAKMHRSYSYRTDELMHVGVLRTLTPLDYTAFVATLIAQLESWQLIASTDKQNLLQLANSIATKLAAEPISLVHGDFYAENLILRGERVLIIDWSWFTIIGVPLMDLATLTMDHKKNGSLIRWKQQAIEGYCFESAREVNEVTALLPYAEALSRIFFLHWLIERRNRGILGTTVGPVDCLITNVVQELCERLDRLS